MSNKEQMINDFCNVSGIDKDRAKFYLEASDWKLDLAISSFFENGEPNEPSASLETENETSAPSHTSPHSRFGTISGLREEETMSSDEERDSFYTGGSEHGAGQQVLGAKKNKKKAGDLVQDMFKSAKEHGAEEVAAPTPSSSSSISSQKPSFRGTGYKLGETEDTSQVIQGAPLKPQQSQVDMVLKLWKNGFSIDSGALRDYQDPENQAFLNSIKKGEVPQELIRMAKGGEVNLNMEDHREEEYVKPKQVLKAFSGEGMRLGSATPSLVENPATVPQATVAAGEEPVQVDKTQPVTNVQIRLADGTRLVGKFNHSHSVLDIRRYVLSSRPELATSNFVMMTTFPNKELSDETQTIEQSKLQNAVIVLRIK